VHTPSEVVSGGGKEAGLVGIEDAASLISSRPRARALTCGSNSVYKSINIGLDTRCFLAKSSFTTTVSTKSIGIIDFVMCERYVTPLMASKLVVKSRQTRGSSLFNFDGVNLPPTKKSRS
jgi:hypothetical protein